jgi:predicted ATPase
MLERIAVKGYKSLYDVNVELPACAVLFGPNAAGKSNFLDAVQALSRVATQRTLQEALTDPGGGHLVRGFPIEAFSLPNGGLAGLLNEEQASLSFDAEITARSDKYRYRMTAGIHPKSGSLTVLEENLAPLDKRGNSKGQARIETVDGSLQLRARAHPGRPRRERLGLNYTLLSDPRLGGAEYRAIENCRNEFANWRTYYLDPRVAMRAARTPAEMTDIGVLGESLAPFLYRLRAESSKAFAAINRAIHSIIPSVEAIEVDLDEKRGTLDILVRQDGIPYSSRVISEGTLRVIALCAIAANPWRTSLVAFEEPENGVHPPRIELIAELLTSLIDRDPPVQLVITTHSPVFAGAMLRKARERNDGRIGLFRVSRKGPGTTLVPFEAKGPLFDDPDIGKALTSPTEDGLFEGLMMRGLVDAD